MCPVNVPHLIHLFPKFAPTLSTSSVQLVEYGEELLFPVEFNDFNFRVTFNTETEIKTGVKNFVIDNWKKSKKVFRYLNRVTFSHPDYPVLVDISITKNGDKDAGLYEVYWDSSDDNGKQAASGVYFYRLVAEPIEGGEPYEATRKLIVLK